MRSCRPSASSLREACSSPLDNRSDRGNFDKRGSDCGRLRDRLASLAKTVEMEADRLADEPFHFVLRRAHDADAGEVGAVGTLRLAFALDYDQVFAHRLGLRSPADGGRPAADARERGPAGARPPAPGTATLRTASGSGRRRARPESNAQWTRAESRRRRSRPRRRCGSHPRPSRGTRPRRRSERAPACSSRHQVRSRRRSRRWRAAAPSSHPR